MYKVGILGGGQLGKMLLQTAANYVVETYVLENNTDCPAAHLCHHFVKGDIKDFDTVYNFGKKLDALTIEIESVNIAALEKLEKEGVKIYPTPAAIAIIKNKIDQKTFYKENEIPTAPFVIVNSKKELEQHIDFLPAVQKMAEGGYDGKGVVMLYKKEDIVHSFDVPSVLEKKIKLQCELSLIIAISNDRKTAVYPPTEMVFDQRLHLLDYQISPARIAEKMLQTAESIALQVVKKLDSAGIFAVELLVDTDANIWVNETAPRVHNSGHHTIEGNFSSQYDMLWRIILDLPLGDTAAILPSGMINILGEQNHEGVAQYDGLNEVLKIPNTFVHLYGKTNTKPGRKMGHVTIISNDYEDIIRKANMVKEKLKVVREKKV